MTVVGPAVLPKNFPMKEQQHWLSEAEEKEFSEDPDYIAEAIALRLVEQLLELMEQKGIAQADLARLMNVSPAYVSRILSAPPNLTLRSISQLALAIGA